jgi:hypothetical protein
VNSETVIHCTGAIRDSWPTIAEQWSAQYPELFDEDDLRLTLTQPRNHFCEWFAAIFIFQRDGALSLVEQYVYGTHAKKIAQLEQLLDRLQRDILTAICARHHVQPPDLLVYMRGTKRFWFTEAKGPGDQISTRQRASHEAITRELGVPVEIVRVRWQRCA